jgi:hypothetical protein
LILFDQFKLPNRSRKSEPNLAEFNQKTGMAALAGRKLDGVGVHGITLQATDRERGEMVFDFPLHPSRSATDHPGTRESAFSHHRPYCGVTEADALK